VPWLVIASAALAAGLVAVALDAPHAWSVGLLALAVVAGGATTLRRAVASARQGRLDMFVLMTLLPAGGIAHLMYLAKPPAALPVDARLAAS
jgi:DMSO reductase anchor subunit